MARGQWLGVLVLIGYLLTAPKAFVLGPLAILLLLSRPRTGREWFWIGLSIVAALITLRIPVTLTGRTIRAAGAFFTGAFVIVTLLGIRSLFQRALIATSAGVALVSVWFVALGLRWASLKASFVADYWTTWHLISPSLPDRPPLAGEGAVNGVTASAAQLAEVLRQTTDLLPALLAIMAMGGGWLAWNWYWRLASHPIGDRPLPFRDFRFSDHLVWFLILGAGGSMLLSAETTARWVANNLLLFMVTLYAARGLAIIHTSLKPAPPLFVVVLFGAALVLFPVAVSFALLVGTADTWFDFRRRMAPTEGARP